MSALISIVIPAYNVAEYIEKCLCTVLSQTYSDIEVIVVNDGSTDDTDKIIAKFKSDARLKYIEQENAGVSAARNNGIDAATGELLAFVDSDDYLELYMYEKLYSALKEAQADVAVCDYNLIYNDHADMKYSSMRDEVVYIEVPGYFYQYCCCPKPNNYIWTRLYKTEIVKSSGVRFENYKLGDDTLFNFKLLPYMKRVVNISGGMYNYLQRPDSNVYTVARHGNLAAVYADTFEALVEYCKLNGFERYLEAMPAHAHTRLRSVIFYSRLAGMEENMIVESIKEGFREREIAKYLMDNSVMDEYAKLNALSLVPVEEITRILAASANSSPELTEVVIP